MWPMASKNQFWVYYNWVWEISRIPDMLEDFLSWELIPSKPLTFLKIRCYSFGWDSKIFPISGWLKWIPDHPYCSHSLSFWPCSSTMTCNRRSQFPSIFYLRSSPAIPPNNILQDLKISSLFSILSKCYSSHAYHLPHSFSPLFIQQIFIKHLLCTRHSSWYLVWTKWMKTPGVPNFQWKKK